MAFTPKTWRNRSQGAPLTPVTAEELTRIETGVKEAHEAVDSKLSKTEAANTYVPVSSQAANPDQMAVGTITRSATEAVTGFAVAWPDGATGVFVGTESSTVPGAVDSYTLTHVLGGVTKTYTQPAFTRNASGAVTNRPAMTVS